MSPVIIKTIAAASGGLVLAACSWGVYSFVLNSNIPWRPLVIEDNFSANYNSDTKVKVGKVYSHFLVGTYAEENKPWWERSYKLLKSASKQTLSNEFADLTKVKSGFKLASDTERDNEESLNKVCEKIYKKDLIDVISSENDIDKSKLEKNLWRYCSPLRKKPKTVDIVKDIYTSGTFGEKLKAKLISVKDSKNNKFWAIRNEEFFGRNENDEGIGKGLNSINSLFKNLYDTKGKSNQGSIKTTCGEAYFLKKEDANKKTEETEVLKFCSLEGK